MIDRLNLAPPQPAWPGGDGERQSAAPEFLAWARTRSAVSMSPPAVSTSSWPCAAAAGDAAGDAINLALSAISPSSSVFAGGALAPQSDPPASAGACPYPVADTVEVPGLQEAGLPVQPIGEIQRQLRAFATTAVSGVHGVTACEGSNIDRVSDPVADIASETTVQIEPQSLVATVRIEVHLRDGSGGDEILAWPWRLAAGHSLSRRIEAGSDPHPDRASAPMPFAMVNETDVGIAVSPPPQSTNPLPNAPERRRPHESPLFAMSFARDSDAATQNAGAVFAFAREAGDEWQIRWERWIERDGRLSTVLVRDYRNSENDTMRLSEHILAFCREHGLRAQRIVINGHERWRGADARGEAVCR